MFLCVSLNPAIDKRLRLEHLRVGNVNRAIEAIPDAGGKAAHVAMVLRTLGEEPTWLGFAGGATGTQLTQGLRALSIQVIGVPTKNWTRTNLEILEDGGGVTEILEPGPRIAGEELQQLQQTFSKLVQEAGKQAMVILSGSLPEGVPPDEYRTLIEVAHKFGCRVFVDTSGAPFGLSLAGNPDFVKPNRAEAEFWSGETIDSPSTARKIIGAMVKAGAAAGAISLGSTGLISVGANGDAFFARAPIVSGRSCVGSGDSTLAGFAYATHRGLSPEETVRLAAACGSANCLAEGAGRARAEDIATLKEQVRVETLP